MVVQRYEYRVVPAPVKGDKSRGAKTPAERFAQALSNVMNAMASEAWEFVRSESLPAEERSGLTGTKTVYHNMLVFRRELPPPSAAMAPRKVTAAEPEAKVAAPKVALSEAVAEGAPAAPATTADLSAKAPQSAKTPKLSGATDAVEGAAASLDAPRK